MFSLDETSKALNDFVIIKIVPNEEIKVNGIFLSAGSMDNLENLKLIKGKVISSGTLAKSLYGIEPDHVILFDKHSIYGDSLLKKGTQTPNSIVVTKAENVIVNIKE